MMQMFTRMMMTLALLAAGPAGAKMVTLAEVTQGEAGASIWVSGTVASRQQLQPQRLRLLLLLVVFGWALPAAALKRQFDQLRLYHQDKARLAGNRALLKRLEQLRPPAAATLALLQGSNSGQRQLQLWGLNPGWYHSCLREWRSDLPQQLRGPYARALELLLRLAGANQLLESPLAVEQAVTASLQPLVSASELPTLLAVRPKGLQL